MITTHTLLSLCAASLLACGPTGVVPSSADHPASATARPGLVAESNTLSVDAGSGDEQTEESHETSAHGAHETSAHGSHETGAHETGAHETGAHEAGAHGTGAHEAGAPSPAELRAAELAAYQRAKPVFEKHCIQCHRTKAKAGKHVAMDVYPFAGHHTDEISASIRKTLGLTGKKPSMPKDDPGVVKGEELARIVAWLDAFDASHPGHGEHDAGAEAHHHSH